MTDSKLPIFANTDGKLIPDRVLSVEGAYAARFLESWNYNYLATDPAKVVARAFETADAFVKEATRRGDLGPPQAPKAP
jgi:hypothetical protein